MCGIFGMTVAHHYPATLIDRAQAIAILGLMAEELGRDSSGVAFRHVDVDGQEQWQTVKTVGPFSRVTRSSGFDLALTRAQTVIGHTRAATQGAVDLDHASPLTAGTLLGTHNGDVDVTTIPFRRADAATSGLTDSAVLYGALGQAHGGTRVNVARMVRVLSGMRGRAALAWTDTARTGGRVWLARAGLSPLAAAVDVDGGLWWASNPAWLRRLGKELDLPFRSLDLIAEGTILSATPTATKVRLVEHALFKPTVRASDTALLDRTVWRGFNATDRAEDRCGHRHRTFPRLDQTRPLLEVVRPRTGAR